MGKVNQEYPIGIYAFYRKSKSTFLVELFGASCVLPFILFKCSILILKYRQICHFLIPHFLLTCFSTNFKSLAVVSSIQSPPSLQLSLFCSTDPCCWQPKALHLPVFSLLLFLCLVFQLHLCQSHNTSLKKPLFIKGVPFSY